MYSASDEHLLHLDSNTSFFDIFTMRSLKKSDVRIPNTMLCEDGQWKEWMFNSERQRTHIILRKHKENLLTIKVVRFFCHVLGCYEAIKECLSVEEVYQKLQGELRTTINQEANVVILYKASRHPKLIRIVDFIKTLVNRNYSTNRCPDGWLLVQEDVQFSPRHEDYFYVSAEKPTEVANYRFSFLKRTVPEDDDSKVDEQNIFHLPERKDITRTLDQGLTHRQLSATLKLIDYLETNLRLAIKRIDLKMGINKMREPFLLAILKITIRIPEKFVNSGGIRSGSTLHIQEYLSLYDKLKNLPESERKRKLLTEEPAKESEPCSGDLCSVLLKGDAEKRIQTSAQGTEVSHEQIKKVRKNLVPILGKLRQMNLIVSGEEPMRRKSDVDSDDDELSHSRMGFLRKVCKKCFFLYGLINKTMDFDAHNNFVDKPANFLSRNALTMISEGIAIPSKMPTRVPKQQPEHRQEVIPVMASASNKNFLKLNMQRLKNGLPSMPTIKRPLSASIIKDHNVSTTKSIPISTQKQQPLAPKTLPKPPPEPIVRAKAHSQSVTNIKPTRPKPPPREMLPVVPKDIKSTITNKKVVDYTLQAAKNKVMTSLSWVSASSVGEIKDKYHEIYRGFRNREDFEVQPVEYLFADCRFPLSRRPIYSFQANTPLHDQNQKYHIITRPAMTLQKIGELSGCPEIVMRNNFIVNTLICDEKTTITYCILTSEMFGNEVGQRSYENTVIVQDMFDCFLEYLQLAKDLLENSINKRIILFNYPGQSYTTYNENVVYDGLYLCEVIDKLLFRLSEEEKLINVQRDDLKLAGIGYGGYLVQLYSSLNHTHLPNLKRLLLVNTFSRIGKSQEKVLLKLIDLYRMKDKVLEEHAYLYYAIAMNSTQQSNQQIDNKIVLNPISVKGRAFLLNNIIESTYPVQLEFEQVVVPTLLVHSKENCYVPQQEMHVLAHYFSVQQSLFQSPGQKIPTRQLLEVPKVGHTLMEDSPLEFLKYFEQFIQS